MTMSRSKGGFGRVTSRGCPTVGRSSGGKIFGRALAFSPIATHCIGIATLTRRDVPT